jgi:hypothetical protein
MLGRNVGDDRLDAGPGETARGLVGTGGKMGIDDDAAVRTRLEPKGSLVEHSHVDRSERGSVRVERDAISDARILKVAVVVHDRRRTRKPGHGGD